MDTIPGIDPMENPPQSPLAGLDPADLLKQGAAEDTFMDGAVSSFQPPTVDELAALFPQFEILELIGKGGMGAVYKVRQKELDRMVALKILPPAIGETPGFAERFAREAKALAKLNHPGIVTIHEFGQQDGLYFILMEFVDGVNLAQLMKTGRISPREALAIVPQICDALQFAHDQGIVHRDIKPENILLDRLGRVKVADFGIAKVVAAVSDEHGQECPRPLGGGDIPVPTLAGKIIGTPQYMAPEQIEHPSDVDHRADIYALGVVFYQMLTGELPGKEMQVPSRKVSIDVRLDEMVLRALEKEPLLRYQTAREFRTTLDTIENPPQKTGDPSINSKTPTSQRERFSIGRIIIGCLVFGLLMGVREEFQAIWIRSVIAGLAAALALVVAYSRRVHVIDKTWDTIALAGASNDEHKPSPPRMNKTTWIVTAFLTTGLLWLFFRDGGKSYPASSLSPRYKAPVIGRITFNFTHPESTGGKGVSYDVKKWGDTQWTPNSGISITLTGGKPLFVKSRVNATRSDAPVAMVTTTSDQVHWETKEVKIDDKDPLQHLEFSNGISVEITWSPVNLSAGSPESADPIQQEVMRQASNFADQQHSVLDASVTVDVRGASRIHGHLQTRDCASLLDALAAAGGWTERANLRKIRIEIPGSTETQVCDLTAILRGEAVNPVIPSGTSIEIPEE